MSNFTQSKDLTQDQLEAYLLAVLEWRFGPCQVVIEEVEDEPGTRRVAARTLKLDPNVWNSICVDAEEIGVWGSQESSRYAAARMMLHLIKRQAEKMDSKPVTDDE